MNYLQRQYALWFKQYPTQTMVTLTFKHTCVYDEEVRKRANVFIRLIAKTRKIQVAGIIILNRHHRMHLHLLLFGDRLNLSSLTDKEAGSYWPYGNVRTSPCYDDGVANYAGMNTTPQSPDDYNLYYFNKRLLNKVRARHSLKI